MNSFRKVVKGPRCNVVQSLQKSVFHWKFFMCIYCKRFLKKDVVKVTKQDN